MKINQLLYSSVADSIQSHSINNLIQSLQMADMVTPNALFIQMINYFQLSLPAKLTSQDLVNSLYRRSPSRTNNTSSLASRFTIMLQVAQVTHVYIKLFTLSIQNSALKICVRFMQQRQKRCHLRLKYNLLFSKLGRVIISIIHTASRDVVQSRYVICHGCVELLIKLLYQTTTVTTTQITV